MVLNVVTITRCEEVDWITQAMDLVLLRLRRPSHGRLADTHSLIPRSATSPRGSSGDSPTSLGHRAGAFSTAKTGKPHVDRAPDRYTLRP